MHEFIKLQYKTLTSKRDPNNQIFIREMYSIMYQKYTHFRQIKFLDREE